MRERSKVYFHIFFVKRGQFVPFLSPSVRDIGTVCSLIFSYVLIVLILKTKSHEMNSARRTMSTSEAYSTRPQGRDFVKRTMLSNI